MSNENASISNETSFELKGISKSPACVFKTHEVFSTSALEAEIDGLVYMGCMA